MKCLTSGVMAEGRAPEEPFLTGLAETVKRSTGAEPTLVGVSNPANLDPGTYEIWFSKH